MAKKLEDILKGRGWSQADLEAVAPLLTNAKFRGDLEEEYANYEYQAEVGRADSAEALRWRDEEAIPKLQAAMDREKDAREKAAQYEARIKTLQDQGLLKAEEAPAPKPVPSFDPKTHKLITEDDLNARQVQFADLEGDAIALAQDISAEYAELYGGKSLFSYQGQGGLRGFRALRKEAVAARTPVDQYVAKKFDFAGRRETLAKEAQDKHDADVRKAAREEAIAEFANPNARPPSPSSSPFAHRPDTAGKQPWESDDNGRTAARLQKVLTKVLQ